MMKPITKLLGISLVVLSLSGCLTVKEIYTFSPNGPTGSFTTSSNETTIFTTQGIVPTVKLSVTATSDSKDIVGISLWENRCVLKDGKQQYSGLHQIAATGILDPGTSAAIGPVELSLESQWPTLPLLFHVETVTRDSSGKLHKYVIDTKYAYWDTTAPVPHGH
jgi:hypothetical protein